MVNKLNMKIIVSVTTEIGMRNRPANKNLNISKILLSATEVVSAYSTFANSLNRFAMYASGAKKRSVRKNAIEIMRSVGK